MILQIIPVMIGVYLAFIVSDWGDNKKRMEQRLIFTQNILAEIAFNQEKIGANSDYRRKLMDTLNWAWRERVIYLAARIT